MFWKGETVRPLAISHLGLMHRLFISSLTVSTECKKIA